MSTVQAFFKQRQKDLSSGKSTAETVAALRGDGDQPAFQYAHVAIQGCCHGELVRIYDACAAHEAETGKKIDFLICCGDFQSIRTSRDLSSMAVPDKHKVIGDFPQYYTADAAREPPKKAPYLTLFVGGNHENSDWLAEESYGGFIAPNIFYLGHSGVVEVELPVSQPSSSSSTDGATGRSNGVVVVGGLSGIFKGNDYDRPYPPRPYASSESGKRSAYHVRHIEQEKLDAFVDTVARDRQTRHAQARAKTTSTQSTTTATATSSSAPARPMEAPLVDIFVSHDWPVGITKLGDEEQLLRYKPYFKDDIAHNALGNPHTLKFLRSARPRYWIAAHLHCFFTAQVPCEVRPPRPSQTAQSVAAEAVGAAAATTATTSFIALDKCAKGKGFLDFVDVPIHWSEVSVPAAENPTDAYPRIRRHPTWLQIVRLSHSSVAQNAVGSNGFTAALASDLLADQRDRDELVAAVPSAALYAANTGALLSALHLPPALPLQNPSIVAGAAGRAGHTNARSEPPFHPPWRDHGLDRFATDASRHPQQQQQQQMASRSHAQPSFLSATPQPPAPIPASQSSSSLPAPGSGAIGRASSPSAQKDMFTDVGDSPWVVDLGPGSS